jgi:hypothetical protein
MAIQFVSDVLAQCIYAWITHGRTDCIYTGSIQLGERMLFSVFQRLQCTTYGNGAFQRLQCTTYGNGAFQRLQCTTHGNGAFPRLQCTTYGNGAFQRLQCTTYGNGAFQAQLVSASKYVSRIFHCNLISKK